MTISVSCPYCGHTRTLKDEAAGRKVRCSNSNCSQVYVVPAPSRAVSPAPLEPTRAETKQALRLASREEWQRLKQEFPLGSYLKSAFVRLVLTALCAFVVFYLSVGWHIAFSYSPVEEFREEMELEVPELAYANGTQYSHILLPDGRLRVYAFDNDRHKADLEKIQQLFPDPEDQQLVLNWGEQLFEGCLVRHKLSQWRGQSASSKDRSEQANKALSIVPDDGLRAHAAWQRLTCGPGVRAEDLNNLKGVVESSLTNRADLLPLLEWAKARRKQRFHQVRFRNDAEGKEETFIVRPLVPELEWFRYWILYEEWGVTDAVFEARKQDFLRCCGANENNQEVKWQAVLTLGTTYFEERRKGGDNTLPEFDDRAALIAVIDRFSGLDPVFSPRLEEIAAKHLTREEEDGVDGSYSVKASAGGIDILRFLINTEEWGVAFSSNLKAISYTPYKIVSESANSNSESIEKPPQPDVGRIGWCGQLCGTLLLMVPFCWLVMVSVHFITVDLPGMGLLLLFNPRYRMFALSFNSFGPVQLILWILMAYGGWWLADKLPGMTPVRTLLELEQQWEMVPSYILLIVLGSILTQSLDNLVIIVFLRLGMNPFAKGMFLDNLVAGGLSAVLLMLAGISFPLMAVSVIAGTITPLFLEKLGISMLDENEGGKQDWEKSSWGLSALTVLIMVVGIGIDMLHSGSYGDNPFERSRPAPSPVQPAKDQPHWWDSST